MAHRSLLRRIFAGDELDIAEVESQVVDRFLDQITVLLADIANLRCRNADEDDAILQVTVARRLEPGVVGMTINFLFQGAEYLHPRVNGSGRACN